MEAVHRDLRLERVPCRFRLVDVDAESRLCWRQHLAAGDIDRIHQDIVAPGYIGAYDLLYQVVGCRKPNVNGGSGAHGALWIVTCDGDRVSFSRCSDPPGLAD